MTLIKQNVTSIDHDRDAEDVVIHVDNGDVWHLSFPNTKKRPKQQWRTS